MSERIEDILLSPYGLLWYILSIAAMLSLLLYCTMNYRVAVEFLRLVFRRKKKTYTREELEAAGCKRVDNSDLNELLRQAISVAREANERSSFTGGLHKLKQAAKSRKEDDGTRLVSIPPTESEKQETL